MRFMLILALCALALSSVAGCGGAKKVLLQKDEEIASLQDRIGDLETELSGEQRRAQEVHNELETELASFRDKEQLLIDSLNNMSIITISDAALFGLSSVHLTATGTAILDKVAGVIANNTDRQIWIEGHTDNIPIATEFRDNFASNWELSSARAHAALQYMLSKHGLNPGRLAAVGYGEHRPRADNTTADGRGKNRRVVIVVGSKRLAGM